MVNGQTASHSYHGRAKGQKGASHGTSQWRIRLHNPTFLRHLRLWVQQQKRRRTRRQPSMPHWHGHTVFVQGDCSWNHRSHQQRRYGISGRFMKKAHHSSHWWQPPEKLSVSTTVWWFSDTTWSPFLRTSSSRSSWSVFTRDSFIARISYRPSVCPSVRLSDGCRPVIEKRLKIGL